MNTKTILQSLSGLLLLIVAGCATDEVGGVSLASETATELYAVTNQSEKIKFNAGAEWKASCNATWLTFEPKSGEGGANTITVSTTSTNRTKATRTTTLTIESGGKSKNVTISQRNDYAMFEKDVYEMPAEGGQLSMKLSTNVEELYWGWSTQTEELIPELEERKSSQSRTRADKQGTLGPLTVVPNTTRNKRDGQIFLIMKGTAGQTLMLDTVTISQDGMYDGYYSVDYSADGKVDTLQQATLGKGIPIVLMGDGFQDREIADGTYRQVMDQAVENLFSEEPIRSLRDYFNVYQVTAVSKHNLFGDDYSTALSCELNASSSRVGGDLDAVMKYVKKVEDIDSLNTLAVVILNTNQKRGTTYMFRTSTSAYNYAVAFCPVIDSLKSERFRQTLTHEAVGHGLAKLADEYVRSTEGSATEADIKELKELQQKAGWHLNVDAEKDSTKVIWSRFIFDTAFADEKIGTFEGGYTFYKGIYRPTEESMMRSNNAPFNAPSRQAIYQQVMKLGLGRSSDYEEFVTFDKAHKPTVWSYAAKARQKENDHWMPASPIVITKTW